MPIMSFHSILFCSSISCHVHYLFPFHSKYLIFFCLSISCPLSLSITFKLSHFLLFINLMSNGSGTPIPCKWSHSVLFINLMFIILGTPFHLDYLIIRMIVSGTPIPFLSHSFSFINLMPTYSIQISHSLKLFISFMPIVSFHSNYLPLFIGLMPTIPGTPIPFKFSSDCLWNAHSILLSFSFLHQSHAQYLRYTYSIQIIPFSYSSIKCTLSLVPLTLLSVLETEVAQRLACLFSKPGVTDLIDKSCSLSDGSINWGLVGIYYVIVSGVLNLKLIHDLLSNNKPH